MANIPGNRYLGKLVFRKGSTIKNIFIAKFFFGARDNGGYYDTGGTANITNATTAAAIRTKICQEFNLDEIEAVWQNGYAKGFVGLVKDGGSLIAFHDMTKRKGHKLTKNGATYYALNDAGLHVMGEGNVDFAYCFDNWMNATAVLNGTFYDGCTFTFQYSADQSTWYTYGGISGKQVAAKGQARVPIGNLQYMAGLGSSSARLHWRLLCVNDEGQRTTAFSEVMKPSAYYQQAEKFTSLNRNTYSGNGAGAGFYMYQADIDAILAECRAYTPIVQEGHDYWTRGEYRLISQTSLPSGMMVYQNLGKMYSGRASDAWRYNQGYYLMNQNYGIYINSSGEVTRIFYAYENQSANPSIRLTASFYKSYDSETGLYMLSCTVVGEYVNATTSNPNYDTTVKISCRFSATSGGPATVGPHINGESPNTSNYKEDTLVVKAGGVMNSPAFFSGYTNESTTNACSVAWLERTPATLDVNVVYA